MNYAGFKYDGSVNLGDQIQSIAAEQFIPRINKRFDRDKLREVSESDRHLLIMQGWFSQSPGRCFPPSASIIPLFLGFHIADHPANIDHFLSPGSIRYFKQFEPVGCRDRHTAALLQHHGVESFHSKCLTITFPRRSSAPVNGKVIVSDVNPLYLPHSLAKKALVVSHIVSDKLSEQEKRSKAKMLLDLYRDEARLVITSRLHCALPCIAMGIPVVFFGSRYNTRTSVLADLNVPFNTQPSAASEPEDSVVRQLFGKIFRTGPGPGHRLAYKDQNVNSIDWNPEPIDIEDEKKAMADCLFTMLQQTESKFNSGFYAGNKHQDTDPAIPDPETTSGGNGFAGRLPDEAQKELILKSGLFDPVFYLKQNQDVLNAGVDPLEHFIVHGGQEGRDPGPFFDSTFYQFNHPALKSSSENPLIHYLLGLQK